LKTKRLESKDVVVSVGTLDMGTVFKMANPIKPEGTLYLLKRSFTYQCTSYVG